MRKLLFLLLSALLLSMTSCRKDFEFEDLHTDTMSFLITYGMLNIAVFIEKGIGRLGMTENDLRELASDAIASSRINSIIGGGLAMNKDAVKSAQALNKQQISGSIARLDLAPFEASIKPTEEEIKAYWENIQDAFMTQEKRKFTYIIASPKPAAANKAATISEETLKDEEKKLKKQEQETAAKEEARKNQIELDTLVDEFSFLLEEQKGAGLEDLAARNQWPLGAQNQG